MSYAALIKIGPIVTKEVLLNPGSVRAGRTLYQRGGLQLQKGAPLIVDHDMTRRVGIVDELIEFEDVHGPWIGARATVTDPPSWLRRGTPCSFAYFALREQAVGEWGRTLSGLVSEVSILSATRKPKEPRAQVVLLRERASEPAAGEVFYGGAMIVRPNSGQVIGVY